MRKMTKEKKELTTDEKKEDRKLTSTVFLLVFPALIIAIIGIIFVPFWGSVIIVALVIYHFLMVKKFAEGYYKLMA